MARKPADMTTKSILVRTGTPDDVVQDPGRSPDVLAPESVHAIRVAIDEALLCWKAGRGKAILFNLSGHGPFGLGACEPDPAGKLQSYAYPTAKGEEALKHLPNARAPRAGEEHGDNGASRLL